MHEPWTDRLSEYLDDELPPAERAALEEHLASCAHCAAVLADLRRVVQRLASLEDRPPTRDLWPGIEARIAAAGAADEPRVLELPTRAQRAPRRFSFTARQLVAAALALIFLSGGAAWMLRQPAGPRAAAGPVSPDAPVVETSFVGSTWSDYDAAVAELERALELHRDQLDSATIRVVEENLRIIDAAIDEARRALEADPANSYLNGHLVNSIQRKVDLLRNVVTLASAAT